MTMEARNSRTGTPDSLQERAHFLPAAQMCGQLLLLAPQAAEVDDPGDTRRFRRLAEVPRRQTVRVLERTVRPHRVDQVIGHIHAVQRRIERHAVQDVPRHHLRGRRHSWP